MASTVSTDIYGLDTFDRADSSSVGNSWDVTNGANLQIVNQAVRQSGSFASRALLLRNHDEAPHDRIANDYQVAATLGFVDDTTTASASIILRAKDADATECYRVRLGVDGSSGSEVATLYIDKVDGGTAGSPTVTNLSSVALSSSEVNVSSSSYDNQFQHLYATIYDNADGVVIEAGINDEQAQRLSVTDSAYPLWRDGGFVGVEFNEGGTSASKVILDRFVIQAIDDEDDDRDPTVILWTFGKLKEDLRALALRDSSTNLEDSMWGRLIQQAEQDLARYVRNAWWLWKEYDFKSTAGQTWIELPEDIVRLASVIWDNDNDNPIPLLSESQFRSQVGWESSGVPYLFRLAGRGPHGGPLLRGYTQPSTAVSYTVSVYRRPRFMVNDDEIPDTPQMYAHGLIWGALSRYARRDSDRTHLVAARQEWAEFRKEVRTDVRQRGNDNAQFFPQTVWDTPWPGIGQTIQDRARYGIRGRF